MFHRHHAGWQLAALSWTLLLVLPALAHGQAVTAAWDPSPSADQVTGYQVCVGTSSLSCNVALAPVGASTTTYRFTPAGGTFYYVATRATNAAGASPYSSEVRFSIPSFAQPANQSSVAGSAITAVNLSISDPDGSPLTITHTGLPVGLSIDSAQRRITGTPSAAGTHNVTVFVSDGLVTVSRSFTWTVAALPVVDTLAPLQTIASHSSGLTVYVANITISGETTDSGRGGNGITSVTVNGVAAAGGFAVGSNAASWSRLVALSVGSNTISVEARDGAGNVTLQQINLTRSTQVCTNRGDLNGDCRADLLWRNSASGQIQAWFLNGSAIVGSASLPAVTDTNWEPVASADINKDGASDLIWRHRVNGGNTVWYLNGTTVVGAANLPTVADTNWQVVASVDVNRDGASDLIWRHVSGANQVWYLSGTTIVGAATLPTVADTNWQVVASADINRDGASDLIWRHRVSGANQVWYLSGTTIVGAATLPTVADTGWRLAAALDIDNNGNIELIWRHALTGSDQVWYLNQTTVVGAASLPTVSDRAWGMIGAR